MQPGSIAQARFDRMAERVPEVEHSAKAAFTLVQRDDFGLDRDRAKHGMLQCCRIARKESPDIFLEPRKEFRVADQAMLDDFGKTRAQLPLRQRLERIGVGEDEPRLMKSADHVLPERVVDRRLPANR